MNDTLAVLRDALTVLRKELVELTADRHSMRGVLVQGGILVTVMGVLTPLKAYPLWLAGSPLIVFYFFLLPAVLACTVAADAFAGERERKTLETLLATPLHDGAIVAGKAGAALLFALAATLVAIACAVVTVNLTARPPTLFLPRLTVLLGLLGAAGSAALVMSGLAILLSMRIAVARSAQQMSSLLSILVGGVAVAAWDALHLPLDWPTLGRAEGVLVLVGAAIYAVVLRTFRRAFFFESR